VFLYSSRRRHTRSTRDWSSDVCSSDLERSYPPPHQRGLEPLAFGERYLAEVTPDERERLKSALVRGRVAPLVRTYLGRTRPRPETGRAPWTEAAAAAASATGAAEAMRA